MYIIFSYEMSGFIFVRKVGFRFCKKCRVLVFERNVCTNCRAPSQGNQTIKLRWSLHVMCRQFHNFWNIGIFRHLIFKWAITKKLGLLKIRCLGLNSVFRGVAISIAPEIKKNFN